MMNDIKNVLSVISAITLGYSPKEMRELINSMLGSNESEPIYKITIYGITAKYNDETLRWEKENAEVSD